jgi:predicted metal-dependent hydrolase
LPKAPKTRDIDLLRIFDALNLKHFGGHVCGGITWKNIRIGEGHVTLGLACKQDRIIEINTILKDVAFPLWYVRYVVYHEMLHLLYGHEHGPGFELAERRYPDFERAQRFEATKLDAIEDKWRRIRATMRE